ncbi:MAG: hypothetical protein AAB290_01420 [Candidatus Eisenbacteria bacterium]
MSRSEPIEPAEPSAGRADVPPPPKPDWLVGADEGARRKADAPGSSEATGAGPPPPDARRPAAPAQQDRKASPHLKLVRAEDVPPPSPPEARGAGPATAGGPVAWKAAASSVPRLRQQPAASSQPAAPESFPGFAQDAMIAKNAAPIGGRGPQPAADRLGARPPDDAMPLAQDPPFWVDWLDRLRSLPWPVVLGAGAFLVLGAAAAYFLLPRDTPDVSLAQIRQHPEAFEGRSVRVGGKAGEAFSVGGSYVFNLYQGRDTIVVYSRSRRPRLHEKVKVDGTASIGYIDGMARVAVLEHPSAR